MSNRLPATIRVSRDGDVDVQHSSGGLVSGLRGLHQGSEIQWLGHCGVFQNESSFAKVADQLAKQRLKAVPLRKKQYQGYYNGMSNGVIWPLFHYFPESVKFNSDDWQAYVDVNKRFADEVLEIVQPGDRVWVHDYQLMLVPGILRQGMPDLQISYFHHIPFPSSDIFRVLPGRDEILQGLLGADLVGFHTFDYAGHFINSVARTLGLDTHVDEIHFDGRSIKVGAFPLGIDCDAIDDVTDEEIQGLGVGEDADLVFLGIDRLDYTKGIPDRLTAFRRFLADNPEQVGRATLVQVCVPTRQDISAYGHLRASVERLVGQINGEFGRPGYTPVQYLYRSFPFEEIIALYRRADILLVTPLRDGLNLVCKEYAAARKDEDGVVILSEFAGASAEMGEALLVNPYDTTQVAGAMSEAARMDREDRRRRMQLLRARVLRNNNRAWAKHFLAAWEDAAAKNTHRSSRLVGAVREDFISQLVSHRRSFLFFDYDGTLAPIVRRPELALPDDKILNLLSTLQHNPNLEVTIVTGRPREFCREFFADLDINLVAEHGCFIRRRGHDQWQTRSNLEEFEELKPDLLKLMETYTRCVPGTHVEHKETSLVWHYRLADPVFARSQARELVESLGQILGKTPFAAFSGKKNIEVKPVIANKGHAVEFLLAANEWQREEAIATFGDDTTDEDMHRVKPEDNLPVHVGSPNVFAKYYVDSPDQLIELCWEINNKRANL